MKCNMKCNTCDKAYNYKGGKEIAFWWTVNKNVNILDQNTCWIDVVVTHFSGKIKVGVVTLLFSITAQALPWH